MTKTTGRLTRKIDNQIYDVTSKDKRITFIPAKQGERIHMLKTFVMKECWNAWKFQPKKVVTLKKQFLIELLDSLS